jgi:fructose-1,6-bisphosphatase II
MTINRNLTISLVRATEAAALAAGRWVGRGEISGADKSAALAMYEKLSQIPMEGKIIIGEERRYDERTLLHSGDSIGTGHGPEIDVVVDVVEGTRLLVSGQTGTISVAAVAPRGSIITLPESAYMNKLVVGEEAAKVIGPEAMQAPPAWVLGVIAKAIGKSVRDMTVYVLDRTRHESLISDIRASGARVLIRQEADLLGALLAAAPDTGVDVMMGVGGTVEGIAAAIAVRALRGSFIGQLAPQTSEEKTAILDAGYDPKRFWTADDLVTQEDTFFATTGVTNSVLLNGVRYHRGRAVTHSLVLRGRSKTRRQIVAEYFTD